MAPQLSRSAGRSERRNRRDQHHSGRRVALQDTAGGLETVDARQPYVHQHQVRAERRGQVDGLLAVGGLPDHGVAGSLPNRERTAMRKGSWSSTSRTRRLTGGRGAGPVGRHRSRDAAGQVEQDGADPRMRFVALADAELGEDRVDVLLDRALR